MPGPIFSYIFSGTKRYRLGFYWFCCFRSRWIRGEQVSDVSGSAGGGYGELRRQHRSQEPLHHLRQGNQGPPQPAAVCLRRRHGHGHREEGKTRSQEEGYARSHRAPEEALAPKGRSLHVLWRSILIHFLHVHSFIFFISLFLSSLCLIVGAFSGLVVWLIFGVLTSWMLHFRFLEWGNLLIYFSF